MCDICNELEQARFLTESRGYAPKRPSELIAVLPLEDQLAAYKKALEVAAERIVEKDDVIAKLLAENLKLEDDLEVLQQNDYDLPTVSGPAAFDFYADLTVDLDDYEDIQDYWESLGYGTRGE